MRKLPSWYVDELDRHAKLVHEKEESREQALVSLRMLVRDAHREFGNIILDDWNAPHLDAEVAALQPPPEEAAFEALPAKEQQTHLQAATKELAAAGMPSTPSAVRQAAIRRSALPKPDLDYERHCSLFPSWAFKQQRITPSKYRKIPQMTAEELDHAKNILMAKTGNSIEGAEQERKNFLVFYDVVRPEMQPGETVADTEKRLAKIRTSTR